MLYEQRTLGNERVDTIRITLDTPPDLIEQYAQGEYTEVMEHYLVLYKPPEKIVLQEKLDSMAAALPDELAAQHPDIYPTLTQSGEAVSAGTRINWGGKVAKVLSTLWDREDQDPENAPELWTILTIQGGYRVIPNPIPATETFAPGEIGLWEDGKLYKSVHPTPHAWTPVDYPAAWELYTEGE